MARRNLKNQRVGAYQRYSTDKQSDRSVEDQLADQERFAAENDGGLDSRFTFHDRAVSGASLERPGISKLRAAMRERAFDILLVEDQSRISRDASDAMRFMKEAKFYGVEVIFTATGASSKDPNFGLSFGLQSLIDESYLEDLRYRTRRGLLGRAREGKATGGRIYGYRTVDAADGGRELAIYDAEAEVVRRIFSEFIGGASPSAIAARLNEYHVAGPRGGDWKAGTIRAMIDNPLYRGERIFGQRQWTKFPGTNKRRYRKVDPSQWLTRECPELAIVSAELWNRAQAVRNSRRQQHKGRTGGLSNRKYPLSGLVYCGTCGSRVVIGGGSSKKYYRCRASREGGRCSSRDYIREDILRQRFFDRVRSELQRKEGIDYVIEKFTAEIRRLEKSKGRATSEVETQIRKLEEKIGRLVDCIADGIDSPSTRTRLQTYEAERTRLARELQTARLAESQPIRLPTRDEIIREVFAMEKTFEQSPDRTRQALRGLLGPDGIKLHHAPRGSYATATIFPFGLLLTDSKTPLPGWATACNRLGCGGRI